MTSRRLTIFVLIAHALLFSNALASLRVSVTDPNSRAVPQAAVLVTDLNGKQVAAGVTRQSGDLALPLPPGRYQVTVQREGFETQTKTINLVSRDLRLSFTLTIAKQVSSITVSDQTTRLDTASDSHLDSLKLSSSDLSNLPVKDSDVISALSVFTNPAGGAGPTVIVDGMERTDGVTLTTSQVQEVRLNKNAYSAELPKPGKDRIEIDTKGGSDELHGGFSFRTRNAIFDARNPLASTRPDFARNGYELNLSGSLIRKKLFFFVDASREDQQQVQPILAFLPTGLVNETVLAPYTRDLLLGRLDWQVSEAQKVSAKYEFHEEQASNVGVGGLVLPSAGADRFHRDYRIELSDQYVLSPEAINNFRMALGTNYEALTPQSSLPAVIVAGAFQEGGAQMDHWRKEPRYEFQDRFSYVKGSFTVKAGGDANLHPFRSFSQDGFGGIYQFASIAGYQAAQPILYTFNAGNPLIVSDQDDYAWFVQTEKQFSRVTLFTGVRHEFQSHFHKYDNLAPRIAAAFALDRSGSTVLRVGAGLFYDRRPPTILQQVERFNGANTLQFITQNGTFPETAGSDLTGATTSTVRYQLDSAMTFPRIYQASATLERRLPGGFLGTADFLYERGNHLFRTRNINAPLPLTLIRPDPGLGNVDQVESSASSRGNILNITLKTPPKKRYQLFLQYTLSHLFDDTSDVFGPPPPGGMLPPGLSAGNMFSLPADNYNLRPEWGPANNDIRHQLGLSASVQLPWHFSLGTLAAAHSGLPYDVITGEDNNQDTNAYDRPPGGTRNTRRGAGYFSINVHLARPFSLERWGHKIDIEPAIDSFNLLNHTNPTSYVNVLSSPLFGLPNAAYSGREMQLSIQVHF